MSSSQRENSNAIFASEKLRILDKLVDAVKNMTIKGVVYELSIATVIDTQVDLEIDPYTVTHTINIMIDQNN